MQDPSKGRTQGRTLVDQGAETLLSATDFARYAGISTKTARKNCRKGRYQGCHKATANGGEGWLIPLSCLPPPAQIAWHESQHKKTRPEKAGPGRINGRDKGSASETDAHQAPSASSVQAYKDALWNVYLKATKGQKEEATRRAEILHEYYRLAGSGARQAEILDALRERFDKGITRPTVWRYRKMVNGQDASLWGPLLLPEWKGKTHRAEFTDEAWEYIKDEYLIQSKPPLTLIFDVCRARCGGSTPGRHQPRGA